MSDTKSIEEHINKVVIKVDDNMTISIKEAKVEIAKNSARDSHYADANARGALICHEGGANDETNTVLDTGLEGGSVDEIRVMMHNSAEKSRAPSEHKKVLKKKRPRRL